MGYVIQQTGLFPHQTIARNVATVPKLLGGTGRRSTRGCTSCSSWSASTRAYAKRYPHQLSGGQRQRVGVARALAADPPVLLMDEPFGAVDPIVPRPAAGEFIRLQREVRKTVLFVTHDLDEAVRMGDRIAVFSQGGHLEQYDAPARLLGSPTTEFVASFVGARPRPEAPLGDRHRAVPTSSTRRSCTSPTGGRRHGVVARGGRAVGVVLDDEDGLHGWISAHETGAGTVADRARRMDAWVPVGASLKMAFAEMLQHDAGWVAVLDGERYVGVLTPATLHEALRRSVESDLTGLDPEAVEVETVATA
jgi:osmoprotectant transport system ATP-binding protein